MPLLTNQQKTLVLSNWLRVWNLTRNHSCKNNWIKDLTKIVLSYLKYKRFWGKDLFQKIQDTSPRDAMIFRSDSLFNKNNSKKRKKQIKYCCGDYVIVSYEGNKLLGHIQFIGQLYEKTLPVRNNQKLNIKYGINLDKAYKGASNGKPSLDHRQYFSCKSEHGIFVTKSDIISLERPTLYYERITINDRVYVNRRGKGSVLFVGPLVHTEGVWFGISLDDRMGKHNGSNKGEIYFKSKPFYGIHCRMKDLKLLDNKKSFKVKSNPDLIALINKPGRITTTNK